MKKTYIPIEDYKCPYGERTLENDEEECYYGNGVDKCPYFIRYCWCDEHDGCIECTHPPVNKNPKYVEQSLF